MWEETVYREGASIRVTSIARTVADALCRPELCGGVEEMWNCLLGLEALDLKEFLEYLAALSSPTLYSRAGFFLERRKETLRVSEKILCGLEKRAAKGVSFFSRKQDSFYVRR